MGKQSGRHNPSNDTISDKKLLRLSNRGWSDHQISRRYHIDARAVRRRLGSIELCECGESGYMRLRGKWVCVDCLNPDLPITDYDRMEATYTRSDSPAAQAIEEESFRECEIKNLKGQMIKAIDKVKKEHGIIFDKRPHHYPGGKGKDDEYSKQNNN